MATKLITDDYYAILELPDTHASAEAIKASYRRLALLRHPDRNPHSPNATKRFQKLNAAYSVLKDPIQRRNYDEIHYPILSGARDLDKSNSFTSSKKASASQNRAKTTQPTQPTQWTTIRVQPANKMTPVQQQIRLAVNIMHDCNQRLARIAKDRDELMRNLEDVCRRLDEAQRTKAKRSKTPKKSKKSKKSRRRNSSEDSLGDLGGYLESFDWNECEVDFHELVEEGYRIHGSAEQLNEEFYKISLRLQERIKRVKKVRQKERRGKESLASKQEEARVDKTLAALMMSRECVFAQMEKQRRTMLEMRDLVEKHDLL